jgi:hypothetical protein
MNIVKEKVFAFFVFRNQNTLILSVSSYLVFLNISFYIYRAPVMTMMMILQWITVVIYFSFDFLFFFDGVNSVQIIIDVFLSTIFQDVFIWNFSIYLDIKFIFKRKESGRDHDTYLRMKTIVTISSSRLHLSFSILFKNLLCSFSRPIHCFIKSI